MTAGEGNTPKPVAPSFGFKMRQYIDIAYLKKARNAGDHRNYCWVPATCFRNPLRRSSLRRCLRLCSQTTRALLAFMSRQVVGPSPECTVQICDLVVRFASTE